MTRLASLCVLVLGLALLAGCGVPGQTVSFKLDVKEQSSSIGKGKTVALRVVDARPEKVLGYRDMDTSRNSPIRVEGNLTEIVGAAASRALSDMGFSPAPYSESASRSLIITIRDLNYLAKSEGVTKKVSVKCVLSGKAKNGPGTWEGNYPVRQEKEVVITPDENSNARFLNDVLSESLTMLISDPDLQQFLGKEGVRSKTIKQE